MAITSSLFKGFHPLIADSHPALIKDSVMSPAGTTARAYYALEDEGVRGAFIRAIEDGKSLLVYSFINLSLIFDYSTIYKICL